MNLISALGVRIGPRGDTLEPPLGYLLELVALTAYTCSLPHVRRLLAQVLAGRWIRVMQLERALMGVFTALWKWVCGPWRGGPVPPLVVDELLIACALAPLAFGPYAELWIRSSPPPMPLRGRGPSYSPMS